MKAGEITEVYTRANSRGGGRSLSFSSFFWSASDRRSDGHESPKCSTTLNHRLPDVGHQFSTPHSVSNCSKSTKYESGRHPDAKSKSKAHLRPVPARGTLLTVRLRGNRHYLLKIRVRLTPTQIRHLGTETKAMTIAIKHKSK